MRQYIVGYSAVHRQWRVFRVRHEGEAIVPDGWRRYDVEALSDHEAIRAAKRLSKQGVPYRKDDGR